MASNDEAVAYLRDRAPAGFDVELIGRAFQIRADAADPDPLFPARTVLPRQVDSCRRLMAG